MTNGQVVSDVKNIEFPPPPQHEKRRKRKETEVVINFCSPAWQNRAFSAPNKNDNGNKNKIDNNKNGDMIWKYYPIT